LSYDQVPPEWLVADLNRRFDGGIAILDPQLAAMPITLTLKLHDRDHHCRNAGEASAGACRRQRTGAPELVRVKALRSDSPHEIRLPDLPRPV
jgi:hypothetical protein